MIPFRGETIFVQGRRSHEKRDNLSVDELVTLQLGWVHEVEEVLNGDRDIEC